MKTLTFSTREFLGLSGIATAGFFLSPEIFAQNEYEPVVSFEMLDDSISLPQSIQNAAQVRRILEQSGNVLCVFQGHVHEERYNLINNIHYYSVNAVVDSDGPENNSYMIVDIYKDGSLKINGFRRATNREFKSVIQ